MVQLHLLVSDALSEKSLVLLECLYNSHNGLLWLDHTAAAGSWMRVCTFASRFCAARVVSVKVHPLFGMSLCVVCGEEVASGV